MSNSRALRRLLVAIMAASESLLPRLLVSRRGASLVVASAIPHFALVCVSRRCTLVCLSGFCFAGMLSCIYLLYHGDTPLQNTTYPSPPQQILLSQEIAGQRTIDPSFFGNLLSCSLTQRLSIPLVRSRLTTLQTLSYKVTTGAHQGVGEEEDC